MVQGEGELEAVDHAAVFDQPQGAVMGLGDFAGEAQAEAEPIGLAAARLVGAIKTIKEVRQIIVCDAYPCITDCYHGNARRVFEPR